MNFYLEHKIAYREKKEKVSDTAYISHLNLHHQRGERLKCTRNLKQNKMADYAFVVQQYIAIKLPIASVLKSS